MGRRRHTALLHEDARVATRALYKAVKAVAPPSKRTAARRYAAEKRMPEISEQEVQPIEEPIEEPVLRFIDVDEPLAEPMAMEEPTFFGPNCE
jgi:hypothetical protein